MRHRKGQRKLQRTTSHRLAMLSNMVTSLLEHERIETTVPKAKEARPIAERMITLGKRGGLANVRLAARTVRNKAVLTKIFGELAERFAERPGGYTRIVRTGFRRGDAAQMAVLELVQRAEGGGGGGGGGKDKEKDKDKEKGEKPEKKDKGEKDKGEKSEKKDKGEKEEKE